MPAKAVKVDLSSLPPSVQRAVGPDLALSIAKNMRATGRALVIGRLGPGIYGFIRPDVVLNRQIQVGHPQVAMEKWTCPSSRPVPGARILAVETEPGHLAYVSAPIHLNEEAAERLASDSRARALIRFAGPCQEGRCKQWTGTRCGVADRVVEALVPLTRRCPLPACQIRSTCRWYSQRGRAACEVCAEVRTVVETEMRAQSATETCT